MLDKIKLTITQVKEPQAIGDKGAEKLQFRAKDAEGKDYWYFTFSKRLFPSIKELIDKEAEVDVEVSEREWSGNTYIDRKVTEVYVDGKSVAPKSSGGYGGGRGFSVEDRASIESQVAFKGVIELMTHDVVSKKDKLGKMAMVWAIEKMDIKATSSIVKSEPDIEQAGKDAEELFPPDPIHAREAAVKPQPEPTESTTAPSEGEGNTNLFPDSIINISELNDSLIELRKKDIKTWSEESLLSYMRLAYKGVEGNTVYEIASKLDKGKAAHFTKTVQDALNKA